MSSRYSKVARKPLQNRSRERVEKIIDATESIINESGWGAASSHEIAKRAGVPPAGVYHFFPDRYMIFDAIIERNTVDFNEKFTVACAEATINEWPELIHLLVDQIAEYVMEDRCARELSFGCDGAFQSRWSNSVHSNVLSNTVGTLLQRYYKVTGVKNLDMKFQLSSDFVMTGFTQAVAAGDPMDFAILDEMKEAVVAYMATWIGDPERIEEAS